MESEVNNSGILDLTKKGLKKIPKTEDSQSVRTLLLDDNELQKIDNIDSFLRIEKLSLKHNQLLRMYGVSRLHNLRELDLSYNGILTIEALKECIHLTHLNLEGNSIKSIEHLNTNLKLEFLNLAENSIGIISDISFLKHLKELYLHSNRISHFRQCDRYLPTSLEILTLNKNSISDLNEICTLSHLNNLTSITIVDNPCVQMTGGHSLFNSSGFDYRPFVLNWCMSVKIIDGYVVSPIESLKAEWLYSQGKGRSYRVGDQQALAQYLSQTCPLSGEALENENERKLRLILSKAQQHQRQLQEQIISGSSPATTPNSSSTNNSPSTNRRKGHSRIQSPRVSRLSGHRPATADAIMSNSFHGTSMTSSHIEPHNSSNQSNQSLEMTKSLIENFTSDNLMTQSLDPAILGVSAMNSMNSSMTSSIRDHQQKSPTTNNNMNVNLYNDQSSIPIVQSSGPLVTASKMMPVPESLMSPDCGPSSTITPQQRSLSALTTAVPTISSHSSKTSKISQPHRPFSSPSSMTKTSKASKTKSEKSPSNSPRKAIANTTNTKILQNQSILKHTTTSSHPLPSQKQSLAIMSSGSMDMDRSDDDVDYIGDQIKSLQKTSGNEINKNQKQLNNSFQHTKEIADNKELKSAILIQKLWRGYSIRKKCVDKIADSLQKKRTQDYIMQLTKDVESTKQALENERKIQQLQMQAINALWKKVSNMQSITETSGGGTSDIAAVSGFGGQEVVQDLTRTCSMLTNQVQQLQTSMRDILNCVTVFAQLPQVQQQQNTNTATSSIQTEIIAVHTPQIENPKEFPFVTNQKMQRPSSLPISSTSSSESTKTNTTTNESQEPPLKDCNGSV